MACRTIEIGMRERFERIIWMAESWTKSISKENGVR